MIDLQITPFERFELRFAPRAWDFADANRAAIDAHFAAKQRANPAFWNGRVLLACEQSVADGVCRGSFLETDYASFDAWRDWGYPPAAVMDCFAAAAVRTSDGAYLVGVMAAQTASAGQIYFPCGAPDPGDIVEGRVDLEHSARRELKEETGLDFAELDADGGWLSVRTGHWTMFAKLLSARQPAAELRRRILGHLASQDRPELSDIRIVRGPADLDPKMPPYMVAFLRHMWARRPIAGAPGDPLEKADRASGLTEG